DLDPRCPQRGGLGLRPQRASLRELGLADPGGSQRAGARQRPARPAAAGDRGRVRGRDADDRDRHREDRHSPRDPGSRRERLGRTAPGLRRARGRRGVGGRGRPLPVRRRHRCVGRDDERRGSRRRASSPAHRHAEVPRRFQFRDGLRLGNRCGRRRGRRTCCRTPPAAGAARIRGRRGRLTRVPAGRTGGPRRAGAFGVGRLAGAAHGADRVDGPGPRPDGGGGQRLAGLGTRRRPRRRAVGRGHGVRALRHRDDDRSTARTRAAGQVRPHARPVEHHGSGRRGSPAHRLRRARPRGGPRYRPVGAGSLLGIPGRDERRRRRPSASSRPGQRGVDDRVRRVPGRPTVPRLRRRPRRHLEGPSRRRGPAGALRGAGAVRAEAALV
ncbi:MAG: Uncharacterized MFS-type transporter, partial [uncultured Nocardioidaceae bacterium]